MKDNKQKLDGWLLRWFFWQLAQWQGSVWMKISLVLEYFAWISLISSNRFSWEDKVKIALFGAKTNLTQWDHKITRWVCTPHSNMTSLQENNPAAVSKPPPLHLRPCRRNRWGAPHRKTQRPCCLLASIRPKCLSGPPLLPHCMGQAVGQTETLCWFQCVWPPLVLHALLLPKHSTPQAQLLPWPPAIPATGMCKPPNNCQPIANQLPKFSPEEKCKHSPRREIHDFQFGFQEKVYTLSLLEIGQISHIAILR